VPVTDWQEWLRYYGPAAVLYARQLTATAEDAEDAVHDGFVRFWPRRGNARDMAALFFTCVRSSALDGRRKDKRRRRREERAGGTMPWFEDAGSTGLARNEVVERALEQLPVEQREVVVLKIWGGLTFGQIAEGIGEGANTVAGRYRYGMEKLAGILRPEVMHE